MSDRWRGRPPDDSQRALDSDIEAVKAALARLRENDDELLGGGSPIDHRQGGEHRHDRLHARRALVGELIGFLDAREDLVDLQLRSGLDPWDLLLGDQQEP